LHIVSEIFDTFLTPNKSKRLQHYRVSQLPKDILLEGLGVAASDTWNSIEALSTVAGAQTYQEGEKAWTTSEKAILKWLGATVPALKPFTAPPSASNSSNGYAKR